MSEQPRAERKRTYLLLLPGQQEPQQIVLVRGLMGYGLKGRIANRLNKGITDEAQKLHPTDIRLFVKEGEQRQEIPDSEFVHKTIPEDVVITVEVAKQ